MSEAQLQRLEKESERFAKEIKQKETENESLREQITALQQRVTETKASFDEIATVSRSRSLSLLRSSVVVMSHRCSCQYSGKKYCHRSAPKDEEDPVALAVARRQRLEGEGD